MTINNYALHLGSGLSFFCETQDAAYSSRQNVAGPPVIAEALFNSCAEHLICSDTTDKDKSTAYFFIKHPYEELFKDGLTQEVDEIIYTDGPSQSSRKMLSKVTLLKPLGYKLNLPFYQTHNK